MFGGGEGLKLVVIRLDRLELFGFARVHSSQWWLGINPDVPRCL